MTEVPHWRNLRHHLARLHEAALAAADPAAAVQRTLARTTQGLRVAQRGVRLSPRGRLLVLAVGKAAEAMLSGALRALDGRVDRCLVVAPATSPPAGPLPAGSRRLAAAHPLPDRSSLRAGEAARVLLSGAERRDLVLVLLSGGASALCESLRPGVTLAELRRVTRALQRAGADIEQLNTVRRALSVLKGGGMARLAAPARVITLALSDVVGDSPAAIGSGPTVPSPTSSGDALRVLRETGALAAVPRLARPLARARVEEARRRTATGSFRVVASNVDAALAVRATAERLGFTAQVVTTCLQGEAREAGRIVGGCAASMQRRGLPFGPPGCLVFGGETTVSVRGRGRGGRNQELALGAATALAGVPRAAVLAFATDGVDGSSDAAGAVATGQTLARAAALGLSPAEAWARSDSHGFFARLGDLWHSGPTGTNVNDLAIALAFPGPAHAGD